MVAAAVGIGTAVAGVAGSAMQANAASSAADQQSAAAQAGMSQQLAEYNTTQQLLAPYVGLGTVGSSGLTGVQQQEQGVFGQAQGIVGQYLKGLDQLNNMTGANGAPAQQSWIDSLTQNPLYTNAMKLGQQAILANGAATGGLRGGNTIASLGYLPSQVLANVMGQQISNTQSSLSSTLGGLNGSQVLNAILGQQGGQYQNLINTGENAAAGTGSAAISTGNNITNLLGQQGAAQAGATIAGGNAMASGINTVAGAAGNFLNNYALSLQAQNAGIPNSGAYASPMVPY